MKGYIYTIPHPRRLLEILVHSGGGGYKKRTVFLRCRATLTHSKAPAANFMQCMCHPCCAAQGGLRPPCVLVSSCHPVCRCNLLPTVTSTGVLEPFTQVFFFFFPKFYHLLIESLFHPTMLRWGKVSSSTQTHTVNAPHFLSLNTYITPKLRHSFYLHASAQTSWGSSSLLLFHLFICLLVYLHPPQNPHTSCPNMDYAYTLLMKPSANIFFSCELNSQFNRESCKEIFSSRQQIE